MENILSVNKSINRQECPIFYDGFLHLQRYGTCWFVNDHHNIPNFRTQKYGHFIEHF